jgi:hypothetical protein
LQALKDFLGAHTQAGGDLAKARRAAKLLIQVGVLLADGEVIQMSPSRESERVTVVESVFEQ